MFSNNISDEKVTAKAMEYAKQNKMKIARALTDLTIYKPDPTPVSVFMAGSPGAGKTEYSKHLINLLENTIERRVIRIDGDDILSRMPGYTGDNAYLFQGATAIVVEKIHDIVLHNNQSFILDSTFSHYKKAKENIDRSLQKNRFILIVYVYQSPEIAWQVTIDREKKEGRRVPKEVFIDRLIGARETVDRMRKEYNDDQVNILLVKQNAAKREVEGVVRIKYLGRQTIDFYLPGVYTKDDLEDLL